VSNYGDPITVDMHRWYAVLREGETVIGVIGNDQPGEGPSFYDSLEEWNEAVDG
jgi:hypothetical protein